MKERPILFSAPMVRAILEGRKTQTRRLIKPQPPHWTWNRHRWDERCIDIGFDNLTSPYYVISTHGKPGDRLWVRETICVDVGATQSEIECGHFTYRADDIRGMWTNEKGYRTIPAIHTFRWMSRIDLEIVEVRVERVQSISRDDAKAEGVSHVWHWTPDRNPKHFERGALNPFVANFSVLWDEINVEAGRCWEDNPWVWVIEFRRVKP